MKLYALENEETNHYLSSVTKKWSIDSNKYNIMNSHNKPKLFKSLSGILNHIRYYTKLNEDLADEYKKYNIISFDMKANRFDTVTDFLNRCQNRIERNLNTDINYHTSRLEYFQNKYNSFMTNGWIYNILNKF